MPLRRMNITHKDYKEVASAINTDRSQVSMADTMTQRYSGQMTGAIGYAGEYRQHKHKKQKLHLYKVLYKNESWDKFYFIF